MEEENTVEDNNADTGAVVFKPIKKDQPLEGSIGEIVEVPIPSPENPS
jgi:hypothetical protein